MKKITLKDIAKIFDVSISTASKAINDSSEISIGLRRKIQQYAKTNNYSPNKVALNLRKKSTGTIGIIIPNILNYFFTQVFYGVEKVASKKGYTIISCITDESYAKEAATLNLLNSGAIDGLIISLAEETQFLNKTAHFNHIIHYNIPMVMFDRVSNTIPCDKVIVDDFEAACRATQYLLDTGCKTIAVVTTIDHSSVGQIRVKGYQKSIEDAGIVFDDSLILRVEKKDDLELLMSFLLNYKKIEGIIALDEITAVEVLKIIKSRGYSVPKDISIIGFTNGNLSKYVTPALTTISQHGIYIGENTARILIDRIDQNTTPPQYTTKVIKTSLIIRDSTKKI